jgi:nicotinamidase-related amidase
MGDYKVLVVVDIQNCFIQGGSLGSQEIKDLKKYIDLVKEVDKKISKGNYDLVVFSKDSHPLNHSSLSDNTSPQHGVFTYHCRNTTKNCSKYKANPTTYMSSAAKKIIMDNLCDVNGSYCKKHSYDKEHFYDRKSSYEEDDYNFYNPKYKDVFTRLLKSSANEIKEQIKNEMNDKNYDINGKGIKTLQGLIDNYISNPELDDDSKGYLKGLLNDEKYKGLNVKGLDLNYLFYGTDLKDIIYALNNNNSGSQIGITQEEHFNKPTYNDTAYNVDKIKQQTSISIPNTKFISIAKGQYCDYESYSAFNYHTEIKKQDIKGKSIIYDVYKKFDSTLNDLNPLPAEKRYSTGLFEYILNSFKEQGGKTNINIDVCGLVTNICVVNTVHQGIAMWEKVYKGNYTNITCKFNLLEYLSIPLPVPVPIPYLKYNYALQINKEADLGKMLLQLTNLKTLLTTKFQDDVLAPNPSINGEISYTVDYDVDLEGSNIIKSTLNFTHIIPPLSLQDGGKKLKKAKAAPKKAKAAPKKAKAAKAAHKKAKAPKTAAKAAP